MALITIETEALERLVRHANGLGLEGVRVAGVYHAASPDNLGPSDFALVVQPQLPAERERRRLSALPAALPAGRKPS